MIDIEKECRDALDRINFSIRVAANNALNVQFHYSQMWRKKQELAK